MKVEVLSIFVIFCLLFSLFLTISAILNSLQSGATIIEIFLNTVTLSFEIFDDGEYDT